MVGRVELVPPLIASDQHIDTLGSPYEFENTAYLILDDELHVFEEEPGPGAFEGHLEARLGETFHVLVPARRHYISLGMIVMGIDGRGLTERAYLPGQLELDLRPGDRAVDIGVIRYHRNPYLEVEGIEVADDHAATAKQFAARFGSADGLVHRPARVLGVTRETAR